MAYTVYMHTTPNGKVYIGITSRAVNVRWQNGSGYSQHKHFYAAIKKYKWENIHHEIIADNISKQEACEMEKELIKKYNATDRRFGYNESTGGESGRTGVHKSIIDVCKGKKESVKGLHFQYYEAKNE